MRRKVIRYNPRLKERARYLRQHMTRAEVLLWQQLRARQMEGYDFDRQRPIDEYIVDFFSKDLMLAIEVDGVSRTTVLRDSNTTGDGSSDWRRLACGFYAFRMKRSGRTWKAC